LNLPKKNEQRTTNNEQQITPNELDPRLWAFDLERKIAEISLKDQLKDDEQGDWNWITPRAGYVIQHRQPMMYSRQGIAVSQILANEPLEVFTELECTILGNVYTLVRTLHDGYLGFVGRDLIALAEVYQTSPRVVQALRGHIYPEPNIKVSPCEQISYGARVQVLDQFRSNSDDSTWFRIGLDVKSDGDSEEYWIHQHLLNNSGLAPLEWVKQFVGTPYVWGGRSAWGLDCSGLSQLFYAYQGILIPRDADQQEGAFESIAASEARAGDLAFFNQHVAICLGLNTSGKMQILHANAHHMCVTIDTLGEGTYGATLERRLRGFGRWNS
jgi:hypothetical protein